MKLETGWNYCLFIAETTNDEKLLSELYKKLKVNDAEVIDIKRRMFGAVYELYIETYF